MIKQGSLRFSKRSNQLIVLLVVALLSIIVVSKIVTEPSFTAASIESLDNKKVTVMKLAAATAATSTAMSLIPGDAAMPIANQIAELSVYFIIILCAILLQKMLISVIGYVAFTYIIPIACLLGALYLYTRKSTLKELAIKLGIFGVVISMAIPASLKVSDLIYSSYQVSIEQTVEITKQNQEYIEGKKKEFSKEDKNWFEKVGDYLSDFKSKVGIGISEIVKKGEDTLSTLLDTIAVLIITSCVIPIVVILVFAWIIKILFGFNMKGIDRQDEELIHQQNNYSSNYSMEI